MPIVRYNTVYRPRYDVQSFEGRGGIEPPYPGTQPGTLPLRYQPLGVGFVRLDSGLEWASHGISLNGAGYLPLRVSETATSAARFFLL